MHTEPVDRRSNTWDIRQGPRNFATLLVSQAARSCFALAVVWLVTRYLGPAGYGRIIAVIAVSQCISQLTLNWTAVAIVRYGSEEFVQTGKLTRTFWSRSFLAGFNLLVIVSLSPWLIPILARWLELPSAVYFVVIADLIASSVWIQVQSALQAVKLYRFYGALLTVDRLAVLIVLVAVASTGQLPWLTVIWIYVLAPLLPATIGFLKIRKMIFPGVEVDRTLLKRIVSFSMPLVPVAVIGYLASNYLDAFFILWFLSTADLGVYTVSYQMVGVFLQVPVLIGSLLLPLFVTLRVEHQGDKARIYLGQVLPLVTLLWSMFCGISAAVGGYILPMILGPRFQDVTPLLWPLMAAAALAGPSLMGIGPYLNAHSATKLVAASVGIIAFVNVILNALLVPRFGLLGCAWATTLAYGGGLIVNIYFLNRRTAFSSWWLQIAAMPTVVAALIALRYGSGFVAVLILLAVGVAIGFLNSVSLAVALRHIGALSPFGSKQPPPPESVVQS